MKIPNKKIPPVVGGSVPGQSGQYGGINPGGGVPRPPIGGIPGQSGQYGGINPGGASMSSQQATAIKKRLLPAKSPFKAPAKAPRPVVGGSVPGQSGQYGGINPGGVSTEAPIGQRVPQGPIGGIPGQSGKYGGINPGAPQSVPPIGGIPGQSGKYGGINPGGDNTGPVGQAVPDGSRIGSIPGQSGQYGGINPTPPPNLSGQMIMPDPKTGAVAGYLPSPQTVTGGTSPANAFSTEALPAPRPVVGGSVPGQSGQYGGINPGYGMSQPEIAAAMKRGRGRKAQNIMNQR